MFNVTGTLDLTYRHTYVRSQKTKRGKNVSTQSRLLVGCPEFVFDPQWPPPKPCMKTRRWAAATHYQVHLGLYTVGAQAYVRTLTSDNVTRLHDIIVSLLNTFVIYVFKRTIDDFAARAFLQRVSIALAMQSAVLAMIDSV